jgi:hypothetical protein
MIYLTQSTNKHIVKKLNTSPTTYVNSFGTFGILGDDSTTLDFPKGITTDSSNIYVCDKNRIVKFDSSLNYIAEYETIYTIGTPYSIFYLNNFLYVTGLYNNSYIRIQKLDTLLNNIYYSNNLNMPGDVWFRPTSICNGFDANSFLINGIKVVLNETLVSGIPISGIQYGCLFQCIESINLSNITIKNIIGETTTWPNQYMTTVYNSMVMHTNGNLYLNNGEKIIRVNSSFTKNGSSDVIGKSISGLKESSNGTLLTYINDSQTLVRYDTNLNFVENVYTTTGLTVDTDAGAIIDFIEKVI